MTNFSTMHVVGGLTGLGLTWALFHLWRSTKLRMYLLCRDSLLSDQAVIPVDSPQRNRRMWFIFLRNERAESVDLTLGDFSNRTYILQASFHLWKRYSLMPKELPGSAVLNGIPFKEQETRTVKSGAWLELGDRRFEVLISMTMPEELKDIREKALIA